MSKETLTAEEQIASFLNDKNNKRYHYNHLQEEDYKIQIKEVMLNWLLVQQIQHIQIL